MKQPNITVSLLNGALTVCNKKYRNTAYLTVAATVGWDAQHKLSPIDSCQNRIRVPATVKNVLKETYATLVHPTNGRFIDVVIDDAPSDDDRIQVTRFVARALDALPEDSLIVARQQLSRFHRVRVQTLDNIKDDVLVVPAGSCIESFMKDFCLFEVVNPLTNDSIFVRKRHILIEPALGPDEIRINKKQRNMLSDNIPHRLTNAQWTDMWEDPQLDDGCKEAFCRTYAKDERGYTIHAPIDELDYGVKRQIQSYIKTNLGEEILVRPVLESFRYEKKKSLYRRLCDLYVGKSTLPLNCRRPHECDENAHIVRMTENNMQHLGIEPMDQVILRYKETEAACHVLPFRDDKFGRTNIPSIIELSIGIPAHIRNQLGITDIQSSVKVDRDTRFIFKKSFNEQLVPIILTLLSLNFFEQIQWYFVLGLVAVLVPVVMYITLSSKRNMRGK